MRQDLPQGFIQFQLSLLRLVLQIEAEMNFSGEQGARSEAQPAAVAGD